MIVNLTKYLFCGVKEDLNHFFKAAQKAGFIEFIGSKSKRISEMPEEIKKVVSAIKILKKQPVAQPPEEEKEFPSESIIDRVIHLNGALEGLYEEVRLLKQEMARVAPFGDFSLNDIAQIEAMGNRFIQYFAMKTEKARETTLSDELIYVGTDYDLDYFISINKEKTTYPGMIEMLIDRPLGILKSRLEVVEDQIFRFEKELKFLAAYLNQLQDTLIQRLNHYHLQEAKETASFSLEDSLFAIEAWVPDTKVDKLEPFLGNMNVFAEPIEKEEKDREPTCMENKGLGLLGEDLVKVYDVPAPSDKDPSRWVLFAFALFFAIIIADAGYGALYLLVGLFLKWKFKVVKGVIQRFFNLILILSISCIIWGILTASFFGIEIGPNNPIRKVSVLHYLSTKKAEYHMEEKDSVYQFWLKKYPAIKDAKNGHQFLVDATKIDPVTKEKKYEASDEFNDNILMELALLIGVIHIAFSLIRNLSRNWAGAGWLIAMIGGYLFFPTIINATSLFNFLGILSKPMAKTVGLPVMYAGVGGAVVLATIQKKFHGIHEILNIIQIFADILSYLRLYALGLAGMIMAATFNMLGQSMGKAFGIIVGILVIILGHLTNITLGLMGGIVHGLRLNFLEWYHYSFEGEGKIFNPLRMLKVPQRRK